MGKITECTPFQASVWENGLVKNFKTLKVGSFASFKKHSVDVKIKYPIVGICRWFNDGSIVCKTDLTKGKFSNAFYDELLATSISE
ncbi:hypothetical protein SDC9_138460 [bioreactor metagenome]|uniref:Uncharacterized protein n=1 Tax=bioreactor metagenome TaxID=1076179 RepID=A0A645DS94_9ZZZZ